MHAPMNSEILVAIHWHERHAPLIKFLFKICRFLSTFFIHFPRFGLYQFVQLANVLLSMYTHKPIGESMMYIM